jgi:hypothetical protein
VQEKRHTLVLISRLNIDDAITNRALVDDETAVLTARKAGVLLCNCEVNENIQHNLEAVL